MRSHYGTLVALVGVAVGGVATGARAASDAALEAVRTDGAATAAVARQSDTPDLWLSPALPDDLRRDLVGAVDLAVERLRASDSCRQLFRNLGADGERAVGRTLYYPAKLVQEQRLCPGASAFTGVGARQTVLCRSFGRLNRNQAAVIVLHEALHQSGLGERPLDPQGMDSSGINRLVAESCGL